MGCHQASVLQGKHSLHAPTTTNPKLTHDPQTVIGLFFSLAISSVAARAAARFYLRRRLTLDDYLLFAAAVCLTGSTAVAYSMADDVYFWMAIRHDSSLAYRVDPAELFPSLDTGLARITSSAVLAWAAIYLVKASFLAFFKQLIWQVNRIQTYYWVVVVITFLSWIFAAVTPFVECHTYGVEGLAACSDSSRVVYYTAFGSVQATLDGLTDLMIVSIPVMLLSRTRMRLSQKLILGTFMSLSLVMVCFTIIRVQKINEGTYGVDLPWGFFWQQMECNIAVLMGGLTVFRTLLTQESKRRAEARERAKAARPRTNIWSLRRRFRNSDLESQEAARGEDQTRRRSTLVDLYDFLDFKPRRGGGSAGAESRGGSGRSETKEESQSEELTDEKPPVEGEEGELSKTGGGEGQLPKTEGVRGT